MHLIQVLAAGVSGAGNGTVKVWSRGTASLAQCYSDFEGTVLAQPSTGIVLDSYGGITVYVNELVDVSVFDSTGTGVRDFVAGDAAPNVEVQSLAFTGRNYTTGVSAAGNPTTLQAVLDLWLTNAGSPDWKVRLGGADVTLLVALGAIYGLFLNVKGSPYSAVGDGVTDDTSAIQAALTAAGTSGAIVFFPPGTYRVTSVLSVPVGVNMWGSGSGFSKIGMDHATADTLSFPGGAYVGSQEIRGMSVVALQANSGKPISMVSTACKLVIVNSILNGTSSSINFSGNIITLPGTAHIVTLNNTYVYVYGPTTACVSAVASATVQAYDNTHFVATNSAYTGALVTGDTFQFTGCTFDVSNQNTGAGCSCILFLAGTRLKATVAGNRFVAGTTAIGLFCAATVNYAATAIGESGNTFDSFNTATTFKAGGPFLSGSNRPVIYLGLRESNIEVQANQAATYTVNNHVYGETTVASTSAGARTVDSAQGVGPEGAIWTFEAYNTSGGNIIYSFGSGFAAGVPTMTVPTGKRGIYSFRSVVDTLGGAWVPLGAQIVTT